MYLFIYFGFSLFGVLPSFVGIIKSQSGNKWHLPLSIKLSHLKEK